MSKIAEKAVAIDVPFHEKDEAKKYGAKWSGSKRTWYVPSGIDLIPFTRWLPKHTLDSDDVSEVSTSTVNNQNRGSDIPLNPVQSTLPVNQNQQRGTSLSAYLEKVGLVIRNELSMQEWVRVEINALRKHRGMVYMELVEHNEEGNQIAKASGRLSYRDSKSIMQKFVDGTGGELDAGMKVLVNVRSVFHPQYGYSIEVTDIDPSFTIGDMEAKINEIIGTLTKDGIIDKNKSLKLPFDFSRVAVISPKDAAGLGDFRTEADLLANSNVCEFVYFDAVFQGEKTEDSVKIAFEKLFEEHQKNPFDAIAFIRGGGAKTDLNWLNNMLIAKMVCRIPVPVMSGIGHERDNTVVDMVSNVRFDTPSKVVAYILGTAKNNAENVINNMMSILKTSQLVVTEAEKNTQKMMSFIESESLMICEKQKSVIETMLNNCFLKSSEIVNLADKDIDSMIAQIIGFGPKATLERGYSYVKHGDKFISSCDDLKENDSISIEFHDGSVKAITQK